MAALVPLCNAAREAGADAPNARPYEAYFASGHYDRRYPAANPTVLRLIRQRLPRGGHVLDFGCGSGRYLMALRGQAGIAAGYDVCRAALARFGRNLARSGGAGICLLGPDAADIDRHLARHGPADVVLCLFGVLSHIEGRGERRRTLRRLAACLKPGSGRLIVSVPNRARRFRSEQRQQPGAGEIRYVRRLGDVSLELSYKLFDLDSFREELEGAGFMLESLGAESLVPEALVASSPVARAFDRVATPFVPAGLGYGLLGVARPVGGG